MDVKKGSFLQRKEDETYDTLNDVLIKILQKNIPFEEAVELNLKRLIPFSKTTASREKKND